MTNFEQQARETAEALGCDLNTAIKLELLSIHALAKMTNSNKLIADTYLPLAHAAGKLSGEQYRQLVEAR